jgi:hypothetical protein
VAEKLLASQEELGSMQLVNSFCISQPVEHLYFAPPPSPIRALYRYVTSTFRENVHTFYMFRVILVFDFTASDFEACPPGINFRARAHQGNW